MVEERNREILRRRRAGETFPALARDYQISRERVRQIFEREDRKEQRQTELAEADSRPDQPNPLHLEPYERRILAEFCGKVEFTPDDVEDRGFWRSNLPCEDRAWRAIVKWMALAGKEPTKPPGMWTIEEWQQHDFGRVSKRY
ncbi:hypothetical protein ACM7ZK_30840 [Pseudomonas aeruginosa]|jgi:hypothetical protein|nr:hypothetical protein A3711_11810 [Erythrobacter sp. HI00D59]